MTTKIFIGTSPNSYDLEIEMIYEYSLRKHSTTELDINWMKLSNDSNDFWGNWKTNKWFTPFSGFRWGIPEFCDFSGRVIYTDVDMINLRDISELVEIDMQGKPFAARKGSRWGYELCVMVIDCERAKNYLWDIKKLKSNLDSHNFHRNMISESELVHEIDSRWNCLDGEDRHLDDIYQLHFTNMSTQPWRPYWYKGEKKIHPRKDLLSLYDQFKKEAQGSKKLLGSSESPEFINFEISL